jgi:hypothetical protein
MKISKQTYRVQNEMLKISFKILTNHELSRNKSNTCNKPPIRTNYEVIFREKLKIS